jgi:hypothetical protein
VNNADFARITNVRLLLLTPDKRVMHFPATNKVRIDNILSDVPEYRKADINSSRTGFINANAASKLGVVPAVQNYRERGNIHTYTQDYAGKRLPEDLEGISPKQQYKLGSQAARIQNKLLTKGLGHTDLHEGNIVRHNPRRNEVRLIDNDAIRNIKDEWDKSTMKSYYMPESFTAGYNNRTNFSQHKQMQHFANFAFEQVLGQAKNLGQQGLNKAKTLGYAAKNVAGDISQMRGTQIGAGIGAVAGLARGAGAGETEEERAKTTALGRVGKVFGNTAGGAAVGGAVGYGSQVSGYPQKLGKYTRNKVADITKQPVQGELF